MLGTTRRNISLAVVSSAAVAVLGSMDFTVATNLPAYMIRVKFDKHGSKSAAVIL